MQGLRNTERWYDIQGSAWDQEVLREKSGIKLESGVPSQKSVLSPTTSKLKTKLSRDALFIFLMASIF